MNLRSTFGYSTNKYQNPLSVKVDYDFINNFPERWCLNRLIMPISMHNGIIQVVTNNTNQNSIHELSKYAKFNNIEIIECDAHFVKDLINNTYQNNKPWNHFIEEVFSNEHGLVEKFVERLMMDAARQKASDIHILPCEDCIRFKYRILGQIKEIFSCDKKYFQKILVYLKIMFGVDITSSFKSRDAALTKVILNKKFNIRISFHRCINGEKVAMRLIDRTAQTTLETIGYSDHVCKTIHNILHSKSGIVCLVGPTGSGKTTSMYAMLSELDLDRLNVMAVEDPVEVYCDSISQTDINDHPDMNFVDCLRSIMRQDPDAIIIGEIRDSTTAEMALRAAMSGHKVFATLHAKNVISAIERFSELGINRRIVLDNISGIISQRLIRSTCNNESKTHVIAEAVCLDKLSRSVLYKSDTLSDFLLDELCKIGHKTMLDDGQKLVDNEIISYAELMSIAN